MEELSKRNRKKLNKQKGEDEEKQSPRQGKLLVVGLIVAVAAGIFWLMYRGGSPNSPSETSSPRIVSPAEVSAEDHIKGPENPIVTLVEYGDFQCPACASYHTLVEQLAEEFEGELQVVYRHFPLRSIHRHAQIAAQAAEAAADQGYFWEYYDSLYEKQDEWVNTRDPRSLFREYADELTLNLDQFDAYMNSDEAKAKVDADYNSGTAAGIDSTPTFFVNGDKIANPQGLEPFQRLIQQLIDSEKSEEENMQESTDSTEPEEAAPEDEITPSL
jgi:protein-disulfide isomerase